MPTVQAAPSATPVRALVVDDEPHLVELVKACLEEEGFDVDGATTAMQALEMIRRGQYDLVFIDIMLPDMDGIMAHERMRTIDPDLARRTVFMSGWAKTKEIREYLASIGRFLPKPFTVEELVRLARSVSTYN
jgi:two-component system OmpR family response regulator